MQKEKIVKKSKIRYGGPTLSFKTVTLMSDISRMICKIRGFTSAFKNKCKVNGQNETLDDVTYAVTLFYFCCGRISSIRGVHVAATVCHLHALAL